MIKYCPDCGANLIDDVVDYPEPNIQVLACEDACGFITK